LREVILKFVVVALMMQYALFCNVLIYCILEDELSLGAFAL